MPRVLGVPLSPEEKTQGRGRLKQAYKGHPRTCCEDAMNFIELAGIRHGSETDLESILSRREQIMQAFREACRSCVEHGTTMPVNLVKSGNVMLEKPESTRALMSFLRACARHQSAAILLRKRGIVTDGKQTTLCLYRLLT